MNIRTSHSPARRSFAVICFIVVLSMAAFGTASAASPVASDATHAALVRFAAGLSPAQRAALASSPLGALLRTQGLQQAQFDAASHALWTPFFASAVTPNEGRGIVPRANDGGALWKQTQVLSGEVYDGVIPIGATPTGNTHVQFNYFEYLASSDDTLVAYGILEPSSPFYPVSENELPFGPGKLHFYEKSNAKWQRVQDLDVPADVASVVQSGDNFSFGLSGRAISGDTLMIGAPSLDAVYVYQRANGTWQQTQVLSNGIGAGNGANFGASIALQGNHALIADYTENGWSGAVYAYTRVNGVWTQTQRIVLDGEPSFAVFGAGLALDGSTALITAGMLTTVDGALSLNPIVYIHALDGSSGQWASGQGLQSCGVTADGYVHQFGISGMALAGDVAVIGDTNGSLETPDNTQSAGIACVFSRQNGTWANTQALAPDDGVPGAMYGWGVALQGNLLAINSYHADVNSSRDGGSLYLYVPGTSGWSLADQVLGVMHEQLDGAVTIGKDDALIQLYTQYFAIDGNTVLGFQMRTGTDDGGIGVFGIPAQASAAPAALALSLAVGTHSTTTLHLGNASAGHALGFELGDGGTLTQVSEDIPVPGMGIGFPQCRYGAPVGGGDWPGPACVEVIGTRSASWYRRFYFGEYPHIGASATIDAVTVGIESAPAGIPVHVKLYTKPHDDDAVDTLDTYQLVPIGEGSAVADGSPHSLLRIPVSATVTDTAHLDLVVEEHVDDFLGMPAFVPGAIASPQTHRAFMTYSNNGGGLDYGVPGFDDSQSTAFGSHTLISPHVDPVVSGINCATPGGTPWLSATPGTGLIEAGGAQDIAVSVDASSLAPGHYSTALCFATKSPLPSFLRIPVELTVTNGSDSIFQNGFDSTQP